MDATIAVNSNTPIKADTKVSLEFQGLTGVPVVTLYLAATQMLRLRQLRQASQPLLIASETAGKTMSETIRQVLARLDKILAENAGDLHTMVANLIVILRGFRAELGQDRYGILAGLERMTGGSGKDRLAQSTT